MKLKYRFAIEKIGEKFVAVTIDEDAGKYKNALRVNEYGMMIIKTLKKDVSREEILEKLSDYFVGDDKLEEKVDNFITVLKNENLLTE